MIEGAKAKWEWDGGGEMGRMREVGQDKVDAIIHLRLLVECITPPVATSKFRQVPGQSVHQRCINWIRLSTIFIHQNPLRVQQNASSPCSWSCYYFLSLCYAKTYNTQIRLQSIRTSGIKPDPSGRLPTFWLAGGSGPRVSKDAPTNSPTSFSIWNYCRPYQTASMTTKSEKWR
jgi:hypothetical protein